MPRTGQPSTRDVEATVRAVEILDVLAEGGELGTTDVSRRTGISASTVSRQLGTLTHRLLRRDEIWETHLVHPRCFVAGAASGPE